MTAGTASIASMARVAWNMGQVTAAPASTAAIASRVRVAPAQSQDDSRYSRYSSYSKHGKDISDSRPR